MLDWFQAHGTLLTIVSVVAFFGTIVAGIVLAVRLPADYLNRPDVPSSLDGPSAIARWMLRNVLGAVVIVIGIVLSLPLVPGPGILFIAVGLSLMSFPGKRKLEHKIVGNRWVLRSVNELRKRFGRSEILPPQQQTVSV